MFVDVLTDLVKIRRQGEKSLVENQKFRAYLKRHNFAERRLVRIAADIEEQIDCTACANCCRVATTRVTDRDVARLAKFLGMPAPQLVREYTARSEEEGVVLKRTEQGACVFLKGNLCSVYEARPNTCQ